MLTSRRSSISLTLWITTLLSTSSVEGVYPQFNGGALSYKLQNINGKTYAHVELFTGWMSKYGPCGPTCSSSNVGMSTQAARTQEEIARSNLKHFGSFTIKENKQDMSSDVHSNYTEVVYAVDPAGVWEQELMKFSFEVLQTPTTLQYEGFYWRAILQENRIQTEEIIWHLQTRIVTYTRSDTGAFNSAPRVITKPVYRVQLGERSKIDITTVDPDGDFVRCALADFSEDGETLKKTKGADMKDCSVYINATSSVGYTSDAWIAVAVMLRDYNKKEIVYGLDNIKPISNVELSTSTVQFVVHLQTQVDVPPTFIEPTLKNGHAFIIYAGATWKISIHAVAAAHRTVSKFSDFKLDQENFVISDIQDGTKHDEKYVDVTWDTTVGDIGNHLFCVIAIDDHGIDSELLCYKLEVRDNVFGYSTHGGSSNFIDVPPPTQPVNCEAGITCLLPIYVRSPRVVTSIGVDKSFAKESSLSDVLKVTYNGETTYKATMTFSNPSSSFNSICLNALTNEQEVIASTCMQTAIESEDACQSFPCHNDAECISDRQTGSFICKCPGLFSGKLCEIKFDPCKSNPCEHGKTCLDNHGKPYCYPCNAGFKGTLCETNINECKPDSCTNSGFNYGICIDKIDAFECDCHARYEGSETSKCATDKCPPNSDNDLICKTDQCSADVCNRHGVCSTTDGCTCLYGYSTDSNCSTSIGQLSVVDVEFLESSPKDGELLTCFVNGNIITTCTIPVFFATEQASATPTVTFQTTTELQSLVTLDPVQTTKDFQGLTNVYTTTATLSGSLSNKKDQYICFTATLRSTTTMCLQLDFVSDPLLYDKSIASLQKNAPVKFISPTLNEGSILACNSTTRCMLMLFTDSNGTHCEDVLSPTAGVTVFPTEMNDAGICVTEVAYTIPDSHTSQSYICFQTLRDNFQQRCYKVETPTPACKSAPCQNGGHCFRDSSTTTGDGIQCICKKGYTGDWCEKGPCPTNNCKNGAYCITNDGAETCLCKAGFYGSQCESLKAQATIFATSFTATARPVTLQCVNYQTCSFNLIAEGHANNKPVVTPGYVSPNIQLDGISVLPMKEGGGYMVNVVFESAKEGSHKVCIQTLDDSGTNQDEVCVVINVVSDVSLIYGFKDRPHFVQPSLPTNAQLECVADEQCHVIYHVTSGEGNGAEKVAVTVKNTDDFEKFYYYTNCDKISGGNCSVDITVIPSAGNVGNETEICIGTALSNSNVEGEERCLKITTLANAEKKGCQTLHCKNGGFCDGHEELNPKCFCPLVYSGRQCDQPLTARATTFLGDLSIPSDVQCVVGEECTIPFETLVVVNDTTEWSLTYVNPDVVASCEVTDFRDSVYMGVTTFSTTKIGTYKTCIQSNDSTVAVTDKLCLQIHTVNASDTVAPVDMKKPHFLTPTLPGGSTVLCSTNKTCHVDLHFTNGDKFDNPRACPSVIETSTVQDGRKHIFSPRYETTSCVSDIVYIPPTTPVTSTVCVQLSLPGKKGENRCFTIEVVNNLTQEKCRSGTCSTPYKCEENCQCKMKSRADAQKESDAGEIKNERNDTRIVSSQCKITSTNTPIVLLAGVGGGIVVCIGAIATILICRMKKSKLNTVATETDLESKAKENEKEKSKTKVGATNY